MLTKIYAFSGKRIPSLVRALMKEIICSKLRANYFLSGETSLSEITVQYCISLVIRWSFFPFQKQSRNLDPSYKMDLDLWDC